MRYLVISFLVVLPVATSAPVLADTVADERARLANARIQIEEERRARAEAERLSQQASETAVSDPEEASAAVIPDEEAAEVAIPDTSAVVSDAATDRMEMSRALEQLRELGSLRDAGYLTEQEFEQLKQKILDAAL